MINRTQLKVAEIRSRTSHMDGIQFAQDCCAILIAIEFYRRDEWNNGGSNKRWLIDAKVGIAAHFLFTTDDFAA